MNKITKALTVAALVAAGVLTSAESCDNQTADKKGVIFHDPQKIEGYKNVDQHPNIVRLCIDGVAFYTTTRTNGEFMGRVPEWDTWCKGTAQ
jgi:hypothetical protein